MPQVKPGQAIAVVRALKSSLYAAAGGKGAEIGPKTTFAGSAVLDSISRWWVEAGLHRGWKPAPWTRTTWISYYYWYATALRRNYAKTGNKTRMLNQRGGLV